MIPLFRRQELLILENPILPFNSMLNMHVWMCVCLEHKVSVTVTVLTTVDALCFLFSLTKKRKNDGCHLLNWFHDELIDDNL